MSTTTIPDIRSQFPQHVPLHQLRDYLAERREIVYGDYDHAGDVSDADYYAGMIDAYAEIAALIGLNMALDWEPPEKAGDQMVRVDDLPTEPVTAVRVVAEYQMMGDFEGVGWGHLVLGIAKAERDILDYDVLASTRGIWGLQLVQFTVDLPVDMFTGLDQDQAKGRATDLLNALIGDSDVDVRWVGPVVG